MNKFLINIVLFLVILVTILTVTNKIQTIYNVDPAHYSLQYQEIQNTKHPFEGIIIGTSHTVHAINPSILDKSGISFYNFALNGSNPTYYFNWYNTVFRQYNTKPNYCIIGIDWFIFDKTFLWRSFEQDAEYLKGTIFYKLLLSNSYDNHSLITNRYPFLKYRSSIFSSLELKKGSEFYPKESYNRGYISYKIPFDKNNFGEKPVIKVDSAQLDSFVKLVTQLHKEKIKIIFVMTPEYGIPKASYETMQSINLVKNLATKYQIPFLNFNTQLRSDFNNNQSYFADWGHLNSNGSTVFSQMLSSEIAHLTR